MSRFLSGRYAELVPYVPGEQPKDNKYIKLNTNESPFPPSPKAVAAGREALEKLNLYSDPSCYALIRAVSELYGVSVECVICSNGSDEVLSWAFAAFCCEGRPAVFPDVTYGFYPVFAAQNGVPYKIVPLKEDFSVDTGEMKKEKGTLFIANPNAPTGIALKADVIEEIVRADPERIVVVDEAYVDFGAESVVSLVLKYENLLVTQTFSKSRSMAGARLGLGFASPALIRDLETIRCSINPYNVGTVAQAMGIGALSDNEYMLDNCREICENRAYTVSALSALGFEMTDSSANFIFVRHPDIGGEELYQKLREKGILVRHFSRPDRIKDYNRITVGSIDQMKALVKAAAEIL
ncbi:MAG: histidinol-phosphate transaminase [Clostridia bacterium]|nr:histidinol-phosphate transaminase [Clostridia bacterium]